MCIELKEIYQEEQNLRPNNISKKCSVSSTNREMQVKNALRFHLNPVRMFKIKTTNGVECRIDVRKMENLISAVVNVNCCRQCGNHWGFHKKI